VNDYNTKSLKYDSAQKASDAKRAIFQEHVLNVRHSEWKIEATPQIGFFRQNRECGVKRV